MCHTRLTKKNKLCKIKSETQVTKTNVTQSILLFNRSKGLIWIADKIIALWNILLLGNGQLIFSFCGLFNGLICIDGLNKIQVDE